MRRVEGPVASRAHRPLGLLNLVQNRMDEPGMEVCAYRFGLLRTARVAQDQPFVIPTSQKMNKAIPPDEERGGDLSGLNATRLEVPERRIQRSPRQRCSMTAE